MPRKKRRGPRDSKQKPRSHASTSISLHRRRQSRSSPSTAALSAVVKDDMAAGRLQPLSSIKYIILTLYMASRSHMHLPLPLPKNRCIISHIRFNTIPIKKRRRARRGPVWCGTPPCRVSLGLAGSLLVVVPSSSSPFFFFPPFLIFLSSIKRIQSELLPRSNPPLQSLRTRCN